MSEGDNIDSYWLLTTTQWDALCKKGGGGTLSLQIVCAESHAKKVQEKKKKSRDGR